MKLRNKKTGDVIDFDSITDLCFGRKIQIQATNMHNKPAYIYNSLAELNEVWEDYEEPKEYWYIDDPGVIQIDRVLSSEINMRKSMGNYFETREEAEKAVEKLKAWKRLKDKGFVFKGINMNDGSIKTGLSKGVSLDDCEGFYSDMELLFRGVDE